MSSDKIQPNKPFVLFLYGFPGAGKTAFARQLAEALSAAHLQHDRLAHELYGGNNPKVEKLSRKALDYMTREFLRAGISVIYDTDIRRKAERRILRDEVRKAKATPMLIWLQIDTETAYQRARKRDRRKQDDHYAKQYTRQDFEAVLNRMQNPDHEDYVVISGKHTFQTQRAAVFKKFYELGIMTPAQLSRDLAKPELVNLVPQPNLTGRPEIPRRNIRIR